MSWAEEARLMAALLLGAEEAVRQSPGEAEEAVCPGWAEVEGEVAPDSVAEEEQNGVEAEARPCSQTLVEEAVATKGSWAARAAPHLPPRRSRLPRRHCSAAASASVCVGLPCPDHRARPICHRATVIASGARISGCRSSLVRPASQGTVHLHACRRASPLGGRRTRAALDRGDQARIGRKAARGSRGGHESRGGSCRHAEDGHRS